MHLIIEWIYKRPARALKVYFKGSRAAAITEKCIECAGTTQEAKQCHLVDCALWPFRPGATKGEVPDHVPSKEELERLAAEKVPDAVREHAQRMGQARKNSGDSQ